MKKVNPSKAAKLSLLCLSHSHQTWAVCLDIFHAEMERPPLKLRPASSMIGLKVEMKGRREKGRAPWVLHLPLQKEQKLVPLSIRVRFNCVNWDPLSRQSMPKVTPVWYDSKHNKLVPAPHWLCSGGVVLGEMVLPCPLPGQGGRVGPKSLRAGELAWAA